MNFFFMGTDKPRLIEVQLKMELKQQADFVILSRQPHTWDLTGNSGLFYTIGIGLKDIELV